jgi:DNA polymerase (family 10)
MKNAQVAAMFERLADLLEIRGESVFRVNAYRRVARSIAETTEDIAQLAAEDRLQQIPGIGEGIAGHIKEYLATGTMARYEEARKGLPETLLDLLAIPGLGPKTVRLFYDQLGISSIDELERAIHENRLAGLKGIGEKKLQNILDGIALRRRSAGRTLLGIALPLAEQIAKHLATEAGLKQVVPAGSLRRMRETIGDVDILTAPTARSSARQIIEVFTTAPNVDRVLAAGDTKGSILTDTGLQIDLRVVEPESFGAALQYFTGSKDHNVALREIARKMNLKINEYGIFRGEKKVGGATEEEIYGTLGMDWMPPTLRENRGEIEAAAAHKLPKLVQQKDIKGDLHAHSTYSDGSASIEEVAAYAGELGYEYFALTDHSQSLTIGNGLTPERVRQQLKEIRKLNEAGHRTVILAGTEVDILPDGSLDFPDGLLADLDVVVASVHSNFKQSEDVMTARVMKAMENPNVDIFGHPTGRLLNTREPYAISMEAILKKAAQTGTAIEINAHCQRLDATDAVCRRAKELGVMLAIGTDAHSPGEYWMMKLGVAVAQRGWLEKPDVLNTRTLKQLRARLAKRRG